MLDAPRSGCLILHRAQTREALESVITPIVKSFSIQRRPAGKSAILAGEMD